MVKTPGGGGEALKGSMGRGVPLSPSIIHDPNSFRFSQELTFFKLTPRDKISFCKYKNHSCSPRIANLSANFKASGPKRHPVEDGK